jgi:hypothetical protein
MDSGFRRNDGGAHFSMVSINELSAHIAVSISPSQGILIVARLPWRDSGMKNLDRNKGVHICTLAGSFL